MAILPENKEFIVIYIILVLVVTAFLARVYLVKGTIEFRELSGTGGPLTEKMKQEWYDLSWSGKNPMRVIRLAAEMAANMEGTFFQQSHLTTSFYSQVKYLLKKGRLPTAIAFYWEALEWSTEALQHRQEVPPEMRKPIQLEVLGAPAFIPACLFLVGFFFKERALSFLNAAAEEVLHAPYNPLEACLIWAKIWRLTHEEMYRARVQSAGLRRDMDENQLGRIARHLGFKSNTELFKFCNI